MIKRFIAFFLVSFLFITFLSNWTGVQAQTPANPTNLPSIPKPQPIAISFNSKSDGITSRPSDRPQSDNPFDPSDRAIIGNDERLPVRSRAFPWSAIGRLMWRTSPTTVGACTGTLISRDLVLTNAHCLVENIDLQTRKLKQPIFFFPSMKEGSILEKEPAQVIAFDFGRDYLQDNIADDWAIFRLNQPLGDKYGYLGWRALNLSDASVLSAVRNQIRLAGYSGDFPNQQLREQLNLSGEEGETAGVHVGCSINAAESGVIVHNCDSMGGASGSSLIALFNDGKYYIVGLHRGWESLEPSKVSPSKRERCEGFSNGERVSVDACRNLGVEVSRWAERATAMRQRN